jgi:thiosulfate dehydrogenase
MIRGRLRLMGLGTAVLIFIGCRVSPPSRGETGFMNNIKHQITVGGRNDRNPLGHGPDVVVQGKTAFGAYCIVCHGLDGQNTGVPFAAQMSPPVPSLVSKPVQDYTDGQLKWIIENGVSPSGMPASRGILSDEEMWSIVVYLRHLPAAGSLGEPDVYSGTCSPEQSAPSDGQTAEDAKKGTARNANASHR